MSGWIGVDLDSTLAYYDTWRGERHIGKPIIPMVRRVQRWLAEGKDVRIFTARVAVEQEEFVVATKAIQDWCMEHIGQVLPITCTKDYHLIELWDDRAVQIIPNTGVRADGQDDTLPLG